MKQDANNSQIQTGQWLSEQQSRARVTDQELATALGYESTKVIEMFRTGQMRVPLNKVPPLASALNIEPGVLMRRLLADVDPDLLDAIEHCLGAICLSNGERKLIEAIRKANRGAEPVPIMFDRDAIITLVVS